MPDGWYWEGGFWVAVIGTAWLRAAIILALWIAQDPRREGEK